MNRRRTGILLGLITVLGLALRLFQYDQSLMGDEMSTLWIVTTHSLGGTIDLVRGDAEITPPLSFVLSWFASKLGSDPNLIKLPSLVAGTASIPLLYLLGKRTVGATAGMVGAAVMALSPFMTYFSGNGRGYSLLILLLISTTLSMLAAVRTGHRRWWVAYAALSCLAMYTHYTAFFVLIAQLIWLLWNHPPARRPALLANAAAALAFLPWLPGLGDDLDSPTTPVLEALQGSGFGAKRFAFEQWTFGHPLIDPDRVPGVPVMILITAVAAAAVVLSLRFLSRRRDEPDTGEAPVLDRGLILVLAIAVATPLGEALLALAGTDLLGARNMTASWFGFALLLGALVTIPRGRTAVALTCLLLGGYGLASVNLLRDEAKVFDTKGPARVIDDQARPGDVVIDMNAALTSPAPLAPLDVYMDGDPATFTPNLPEGQPPFLPLTPIRPEGEVFDEAFDLASGHRVFLLAPDQLTIESSPVSRPPRRNPEIDRGAIADGDDDRLLLPDGATITESEGFPAYYPWSLYTIDVPG